MEPVAEHDIADVAVADGAAADGAAAEPLPDGSGQAELELEGVAEVLQDVDNGASDNGSNTDSDHTEALDMALELLEEQLGSSGPIESGEKPASLKADPADTAEPATIPTTVDQLRLSVEEKRAALLRRMEARDAKAAKAAPVAKDAVPDPESGPAEIDSRSTRKKTGAEIVVPVGTYGSLHYYPLNNTCTAICRAKGHHDCKKSRTFNPFRKGGSGSKSSGSAAGSSSVRDGQGRPIGLLVHWLMCQGSHASRQSHCESSLPLRFSLDERKKAREYFSSLDRANEILERERPTKEGETEEPEFIY